MSDYTGRRVNIYTLADEIGSGSFGSIYLGQHLFLPNRMVAIKLLHAAQLQSKQERSEFLRRVRMLEALKHAYILAPIDVGIDGDLPYVIAEYAPGGSLRDILKAQGARTPHPLPPEQYRGAASQGSDQYALGSIAYEMLTGHSPFDADQDNPNLSSSIGQAILKALAKEPSERHADVSAFLDALRWSEGL